MSQNIDDFPLETVHYVLEKILYIKEQNLILPYDSYKIKSF